MRIELIRKMITGASALVFLISFQVGADECSDDVTQENAMCAANSVYCTSAFIADYPNYSYQSGSSTLTLGVWINTPMNGAECAGSCASALPGGPITFPPPPANHPATGCGSVIHLDNQSVGETVPVVGAPFDLVYFSDRVRGRSQLYQLSIPLLTLASAAPGLTGVLLDIYYAGRHDQESFNPADNLSYNLVWDGLDNNGNVVPGTIIVGFVFQYTNFLSYPIPLSIPLGTYRADLVGLGGWAPSILHFFDGNSSTIYFGDGSTRYVHPSNYGYNEIAGNADGSELYVFDTTGKHLQTLNGLTGATIYSFNYDTSGRLSSIVDAYGNQTTVLRNGSGVLTGIQAPYGQTTTFTLDTNGYLASITNPNSETYNMTYVDAGGLLHTFQKPRGQTTTMTYDSNGLLTADSSSAGNSTTLTASTDGSGNLDLQSTSAMGVSTGYVIAGSLGTTQRTTNYPDATQSSFTEAWNANSSFTSPSAYYYSEFAPDARLGYLANFASTINRDNWSDTVSQSVPGYTSGSGNYFSFTNIDTQHNVNGNVWDNNYVLSTGKTTITSPKSRKFYITNDTYGKPTSLQLASYSPLQYTYDSHGRLYQLTQNTRQTTLAYNTSGYVSSVTDAMSEQTSFTYDNAGRVLTQTLPDTRVINYSWDSNGNLTSVSPPSGNAHSFSFNNFDLTSIYSPPVPSPSPSSLNTVYSYDNDKRITQVQRPDGNSVTLSYDPTAGTLMTVTLPTGSNSYTIGSGLVTNTVSADNIQDSLSYSYSSITQDAVSLNGTSLGEASFNWNVDYNLSNVTIYPGAGSSSSINYTYDTDALMTAAGSESITRSSTTGQVTATLLTKIRDFLGYDTTYGELASYTAQYSPSPSASPSPIMSEGFTRDALGRISAESVSLSGATAVPYGYTYDAAGRLTAVTKNGSSYSSYTYDSNSNRTSGNVGGTSFTATYDAQDRLLTYNTKTYTYTLNGDRASLVDSSLPSGHQTTTYTFDELGNLKQVVTPTTTVNYVLDGFNRRVQKVNGTTVQATYLYRDQTRIEAVLSASGALSERFVYGTKSNVPDYMVKSGTTYRIISDERGSVRFVVNASTGAISQHIDYDEFGNVLTDTSPGFQPFYFAGCLWDNDTKLCQFGARAYDPSTGRWLSKDPILFRGGDTNLYGYVLQDPINGIDPQGLWTIQIGVTSGFSIGPVSFSAGFGFALDGHGNIGLYSEKGGALGFGAKGNVGGSFLGSNADSISDLAGPFNTATVGGGAGAYGGYSIFAGISPNGPVTGAGVNFGLGFGAGGSAGVDTTTVCPFGH